MIGTKFRELKNKIINKKNLNIFVKTINLPVIGSVYDFFYFKHIKKRVKNLDTAITVEPNNICNLKCIMCPYQKMKRKKETMSISLFKKIIDEAKEIGCKDVHLTQYNEPFTDQYLFERLKYIRDSGMISSFYSNATLLNNEKINKLLENPVDLIRFSVDGFNKKTFESIRKGANYEQVVKNITALYNQRNQMKKKLPVIEVYFTILENNQKEIAQFKKFWKNKCDNLSFYPADSRESKDFVQVNYSKLKPYPCFNPKRIIILSNGKVALCCVDVDGKVELGDLNKQTLKEIINSKKFKDIYASHLNRTCNLSMCKNCSKFYIDSAFSWWNS